MNPDMIFALAALAGVVVVSLALLRAWDGWLALKRWQVERAGLHGSGGPVAGLIELADLRERLRRLEAIAAGLDP